MRADIPDIYYSSAEGKFIQLIRCEHEEDNFTESFLCLSELGAVLNRRFIDDDESSNEYWVGKEVDSWKTPLIHLFHNSKVKLSFAETRDELALEFEFILEVRFCNEETWIHIEHGEWCDEVDTYQALREVMRDEDFEQWDENGDPIPFYAGLLFETTDHRF